MTIDTLLSADKGDASGFWFLSLMAQLVFPHAQVWGDVAAVGRSDAEATRGGFFAARRDRGSIIGAPGTDFDLGRRPARRRLAGEPGRERVHATCRTRTCETLLIGGDARLRDAAAERDARAAAAPSERPPGRAPGLGHTDDFWAYQPAAGTRLVNTFLDSGQVDASLYTPRHGRLHARRQPGRSRRSSLGAMVGLAGLTVLSLALMARRVRRRGRFGRKASAVLRSVYPSCSASAAGSSAC